MDRTASTVGQRQRFCWVASTSRNVTRMAEQPTEALSYAAHLTFLAESQGDQAALTVGTADSAETLTFAEFDVAANRMGRHLQSLGAGVGDFVTIAEPNSVEFVVACAACWKIGAIPQPVSSRLPGRELEAIIELADAAVVVGIEEERAAGLGGRATVALGFRPGDDVDGSPLPDAVSPAWKAPTSGGSTGRPKLIVSGDPSRLAASQATLGTGLGIRLGGTMLIPGPLYHNGPLVWSLTNLIAGAHTVVLPRFDAEGTLAAIQKFKATALYLVPTMMQRMWKLEDDTKFAYDLSSLERAVHLAEPCPPWLKEVWMDWIGPEVLWELYGGTEGQSATMLSGTDWLAHRGSVGVPISGEIKIFDDDGAELPAGEVGGVWMRPVGRDTPTYRYIGAEPERMGDWECLGDIGWMDEDGFLYLADRRTDMILVGGANIYPAEIEAAIGESPLVQSSAVIGLPDDDKGNRVHAIVQPAEGTAVEGLQEQLIDFLGDRLVRYKMPRTFEFVEFPLRDDAGKVRRKQMRAERLESDTTTETT